MLHNLLRHGSHSHSGLPYNLNWRLKAAGPFYGFLSSNPVVVADIGARGGCPEELAGLKAHIDYYAFDADVMECSRLKGDGFHSFRALPFYVGDRSGTIPFHLYKRPAESSALGPSDRYRKMFGDDEFGIARTVQVESRTLDDLIATADLVLPDLIKIDVQGGELAALASCPNAIANATLVEVEVEFVQLYEGQPLFHEVCAFMYARGFEMLHLNRVFGQRAGYAGSSRGQLVFGDALFGRREDALANMTSEALAKYIVLLINYGHRDYASQLLGLFPRAAALLPDVGQTLKPTTRLRQGLIAQYDKLICLMMSLRSSNHLRHDSDRSWPAR